MNREHKLKQQLTYKLFNQDKQNKNVYRWFDRHYELRVTFKDKEVGLQLIGDNQVRDTKVFKRHHNQKILEVIYNTIESISNTRIYN